MCKIFKYKFACEHGLTLRRSKCGGTKHKRTRSGSTPACKSESYIMLKFEIDCGPCQHRAFEKNWERKLSTAELFLEKVKEKGFPGIQEVTALVEQLKDEFNTASWDTRTLFPHVHKERAVRISLGHFEKRSSPLRQELLSEDIPEPPEVIDPNHPDYVYDWDYVASTDPLHPIDVNYAHPLDDVDPSWMLNHLSPEEFEQSSGDTGFDASEVDIAWGGSIKQFNATSTIWDEDARDWSSKNRSSNPPKHNSGQSCEAQNRHPSASAHTEASTEEQVSAERIRMVIQEFWSAVNDKDSYEQRPQQTTSTLDQDLFDTLNSLHISHPDTPHTGLLTPPQTPPRLLTDGSCDSHSPPPTLSTDSRLLSLSPPSTHTKTPAAQSPDQYLRCPETPAPNSTQALYDKWRRHVSKTKDADRVKFYKDWLCLSRCEVKDVEGPSGRFVQDPQLPQDANAKNGWWR